MEYSSGGRTDCAPHHCIHNPATRRCETIVKYLYLYKAVAPRNPATGEIDDFVKPNLEIYSYIAATAITCSLAIWAVWAILV